MEATWIFPFMAVLTFSGIGVIVYCMRKGTLATIEANHPEQRVDALAEALGLAIVRGEPSYNLARGPAHSVGLALLGVDRQSLDVLLRGIVQNRPVELLISESQTRVKARYATLYKGERNESRLTIGSVRLAGSFECWLELNNDEYMRALPQLGLPVVHRIPGPHGTLVVTAEYPEIVEPLIPFLRQAMSLLCYIHVIGVDSEVSFPMTPIGRAFVMPHMARIQAGLLAMATACEQVSVARPSPWFARGMVPSPGRA